MISSGKVKQQALTVIIPVSAGYAAALRQFLEAMASSPKTPLMLGFSKSPSTHFARFVLVSDRQYHDRLIFTSNYDGTLDDYIQELFQSVGPAMAPIWSFCDGCEQGVALHPAKWAQFVKDHQCREQMFFVSHPGISVTGIKREARLREGLECILSKSESRFLFELASLLSVNPDLGATQATQSRQTPAWVGEFLNWLVGINPHAANPNTIVRTPAEVSVAEDSGIQNALTVVAPIKNNLLSQLILRGVLFTGSLAVRRAWGSLSGITSIHFARWLILDSGKTLLFESNYDGSWESYIDEFVDVSSSGLNAIWANCDGFPKRGCQDIESFKSVIRSHQFPALFFFRAYPSLTVKNVLANHSVSTAMNAFINSGDVGKVLAGSSEVIV